MRGPCTVSSHRRAFLRDFSLVSCAAGTYATPADVAPHFGKRSRCSAPATVARALEQAKKLELSSPPDLDGQEHWFRTHLPAQLEEGTHVLCFDGLATICRRAGSTASTCLHS